MNLHFELITPENWRIFNALKVKKEQEQWVASNVSILARAYAYREHNSVVYGIYNCETPIGIIMQRDYLESGKTYCVLDKFMIAGQFQGKGYGKKVMQKWISLITEDKKHDAIMLCYKEEDKIACNLYKSLGFKHIGEADEDEITMEYQLFT